MSRICILPLRFHLIIHLAYLNSTVYRHKEHIGPVILNSFFQNRESRLKAKVYLGDRHDVCVSESHIINFGMIERILLKFGKNMMAPEPIPTAYSKVPPIDPCRMYVYVIVIVRQRQSEKIYRSNEY
jgi:hypothetical protein